MDYTPISARRVIAAFAITGFAALLPALYVWLQSRGGGPLRVLIDPSEGYRGIILGTGSAVLAATLVALMMFIVAIGRRVVRRPSRA